MPRVLVRYVLKDGFTDENARLVRAVYDELRATRPEGFRYVTFRLDDGKTHFHLADVGAENPLPKLASFKAFTKDIGARCAEPPQTMPLTTLDQYGFFDDEEGR